MRGAGGESGERTSPPGRDKPAEREANTTNAGIIARCGGPATASYLCLLASTLVLLPARADDCRQILFGRGILFSVEGSRAERSNWRHLAALPVTYLYASLFPCSAAAVQTGTGESRRPGACPRCANASAT